jgi:hypothetical protein
MPLALACNQLIGLSDYGRVECNGGGVCTEAGASETGPDAPKDAPPVQLVDASGTKPVQWPQFRMPNYPQDGGPDVNIPTYAPAADGGLLDSVSKLVWREPIPQNEKGAKSYEDAQTVCAAAPGGWRLPSRIELVTLLNLDVAKTTKIDDTFASTEPAPYWTTSQVRPDVGGARKHWTVDFANGGLSQTLIVGQTANVRCIKDSP